MEIKIHIYTEKEGYSLDITGPRNGLILQRRFPNLLATSSFLTQYVNSRFSNSMKDVVDDFVEQCGVVDRGSTQAEEVYRAFRDWHTSNVNKRAMSVSRFSRLFEKRFEKTLFHGKIYYEGFALKDQA